ncbi:MAG: c-type cytochrome [Flavobacteriaceae bacterium]|nr:c-type cytochrome [Flavobacteriaceae bacterium]
MKTLTSYFRVIGIVLIAFGLFEFAIDSGDQMAIEKYPLIWSILIIIALFAIAIEVSVGAIKNILYRSLDDAARKRYDAALIEDEEKQFAGVKKLISKLGGGKAIEEEETIILDHDYDGIKELDNKLPPWWLYLFYITIVFAAVYLVRYHILDADPQKLEFEKEVAAAQIAIEEYKAANPDLISIDNVELLTDAGDLSAGKSVFATNCVACHQADGGGGIGPNLTDNKWILGGGIKNVFKTISEGGRDGKGMVSWKQTLNPREMAQVASYVLTFVGTTPANPKEAEGDITWPEEETPGEEAAPADEGAEETPAAESTVETTEE